MKQLEHMNLPVPMSSTVQWTLSKTHVKVAFRMCVSALYIGNIQFMNFQSGLNNRRHCKDNCWILNDIQKTDIVY